MSELSNHVADLVEIALQISESSRPRKDLPLQVDLRVGKAEATLGDYEVSASVSRLFLALDLIGHDIVMKSRFGEPTKEPRIESESTFRSVVRSSAEAQAEVGFKIGSGNSSAALSAGGKGQMEYKHTEDRKNKTTEIFYRVQALPNNMWKVEEYGGAPLEGTYLNGDVLCKVKVLNGANHSSISVHVYAKPRDIIIDITKEAGGFLAQLTTNKKKLLQQWIKIKALEFDANEQYVTLSLAALGYESNN